MILSDSEIKELIEKGLLSIEPMEDDTIRENGVDLRFSGLVGKVKDGGVFTPGESDPEEFFVELDVDEYVIRPGEFIILSTREYIRMPDDVMAFINLRSSFARLGLLLSPTIVDAGYEGNLTVGLYSSSFSVRLRKGERFLHVIFGRMGRRSSSPYRGRYHGVRGLAKPFSKG